MSRRKRPDSRSLEIGLNEVDSLVERKMWEQAHDKLDALDKRYPNHIEVLTELVNACYEPDDNDPDLMLALAGAYIRHTRYWQVKGTGL